MLTIEKILELNAEEVMTSTIRLSSPVSYAIMASGTGTNALALVDHGIDIGRPPAFVLVNKKNSPLFIEVPKRSIPVIYIPSMARGIDESFERKVIEKCREYQVEWIFLAGFMKVLGSEFLGHFEKNGSYKVINIHPSLLPKYPGLGSYEQAFNAGDKVFGHTLHLVNEGLDEGPILYQKELPLDRSRPLDNIIEEAKAYENASYKKLLQYMMKNDIVLTKENGLIKASVLDLDKIEIDENNEQGHFYEE